MQSQLSGSRWASRQNPLSAASIGLMTFVNVTLPRTRECLRSFCRAGMLHTYASAAFLTPPVVLAGKDRGLATCHHWVTQARAASLAATSATRCTCESRGRRRICMVTTCATAAGRAHLNKSSRCQPKHLHAQAQL